MGKLRETTSYTNANMTWPDRIVSYFNPQAGVKRYQQRKQLNKMTSFTGKGGYNGASKSRSSLSAWDATSNSADADIIPDLDELRARSRDSVRNNTIGAAIVRLLIQSVIGDGLRVQPDLSGLNISEDRKSELQESFRAGFEHWMANKADITNRYHGGTLQDLALRSTLENGDVFSILPIENDELKVQLVEADRVNNPDSKMDTDTLRAGVEMDEYGRPVAFYLAEEHPGKNGVANRRWKRIERIGVNNRINVIHIMKPLRVGQTRGVPLLAPVLENLKQLEDYIEAELSATVTSSLFTMFVTHPEEEGIGDDGDTPPAGDDNIELGRGTVYDLAPGENAQFADPTRPNDSFDPFVQAQLKQIGMAIGIPTEVLAQTFESSYSASRASLEMFWETVLYWRNLFIRQFLKPLYKEWLRNEILKGNYRIALSKLEDYANAEFIGPSQISLDPNKEIEAATKRIESNLSTYESECHGITGKNWNHVVDKLSREQQKLIDYGLNTGDDNE